MIGVAALNLVTSASMLGNPKVRALAAASSVPLPVQYAMIALGVIAMMASGIGMLRGHNWARWLYVIWTAGGTVVGLVASPMKLLMVPSIVAYLVVVFFLFRPAPNRYFGAEPTPRAQDV